MSGERPTVTGHHGHNAGEDEPCTVTGDSDCPASEAERGAGPVAEVAVTHPARRLRVEVTDSGDELPHRRGPGEMSPSGPRCC